MHLSCKQRNRDIECTRVNLYDMNKRKFHRNIYKILVLSLDIHVQSMVSYLLKNKMLGYYKNIQLIILVYHSLLIIFIYLFVFDCIVRRE